MVVRIEMWLVRGTEKLKIGSVEVCKVRGFPGERVSCLLEIGFKNED